MGPSRIDLRRLESKLTEEHLRIREDVARLQTLTDPTAMLETLEALRHFLHEEGGKGLALLVERCAPEHEKRAEALLLEHRALMADLHELIRECRALITEPLTRLRRNTAQFIDRLQAHDVSETEVLTDCMLREMERTPKRPK
mgnify:CR=1 FL=1